MSWMIKTLGVGVVCVLVVGCLNTKLIKATASYAKITETSAAELAAAPGIVGELCRERLELEYLTQRLIPGANVSALQDFVDKPFKTASGNTTITWKQRCAGLRHADDAFSKGLDSIRAYGAALGEFAGKDLAPGDDIKALAKSAADSAAKLTDDAKPYQAAIEGLGSGLTGLAHAIEGRWKGNELKQLVAKTDQPLQSIIKVLGDYIQVARKRQLLDVRVAVKDLVSALDQRSPNGIALLTLTGRLDIEVTAHLDQLDGKLKAMSDVLLELASAHAKLNIGWQKGEEFGVDTMKAMATLAKDVYTSVKAFQNPTGGEP